MAKRSWSDHVRRLLIPVLRVLFVAIAIGGVGAYILIPPVSEGLVAVSVVIILATVLLIFVVGSILYAIDPTLRRTLVAAERAEAANARASAKRAAETELAVLRIIKGDAFESVAEDTGIPLETLREHHEAYMAAGTKELHLRANETTGRTHDLSG